MNQSIPLRNISLQNEIGLGEECLTEQAPDQFLIAWRGTYLDDDYVITDQAVINALSDWKKEVKPYIDQRDADDLTNVIGLYRHEINDH